MVGVAQLVEPRFVAPVVVGSSPIVHPIFHIDVSIDISRLPRSGRRHYSACRLNWRWFLELPRQLVGVDSVLGPEDSPDLCFG